MTKETALIDLTALNPAEIFVPNGTDKLIKIVEAEIAGFQGDVTTEEGRKEIWHLDRKIASSKTAVDKLRKEFTADVRQKLSDINDEGKKFVERMEELQKQVSAPLDEYKAKEKARVEALTERLNIIKGAYDFPIEISSGELEARIQSVNEANKDFDWQDFERVAGEETEKALSLIESKLSQVKEQEAQAAELEKLRLEAAERAKKDEEERLRKEGEERAKRESEEKAERDRKAAEESVRIEQERAAKAEIEKQEALKREQEAKDNAERLAKEAAEKARLDEIARQEAEVARIKAEEEAREKDKKHRTKINNEALQAIAALGFEEKDAKDIVTAIAQGKIPHVKIQY